jgi:hypothetical protein
MAERLYLYIERKLHPRYRKKAWELSIGYMQRLCSSMPPRGAPIFNPFIKALRCPSSGFSSNRTLERRDAEYLGSVFNLAHRHYRSRTQILRILSLGDPENVPSFSRRSSPPPKSRTAALRSPRGKIGKSSTGYVITYSATQLMYPYPSSA